MLLLHRRLKDLATLTTKHPSRRYPGITGVKIVDKGEGKTELHATDGHRLMMVEYHGPVPHDFPVVQGFDASANGVSSLVVPADGFKDAFKGRLKRTSLPILEHTAVTLTQEHVTFATTDLETARVMPIRPLEGDFPDIEQVMPKGEPQFTIRMNPQTLAELLKVLGTVTGTDWVDISVYDSEDLPMVCKAEGDQVHVTAIQMPIARPMEKA